MTAARYHEIASAIAALEAEGVSISAKHLHAKMGGNYPALVQALRQYRQLVAQAVVEPSVDVVVDTPTAEPVQDPGPWVPPACPRCQVRVVWVVQEGLWTCTACSTTMRRVEAERPRTESRGALSE